MNYRNRKNLAILLALVILYSVLAGPLEAYAADPSKDIYLDGVQNYLMAAEVVKIINEERKANGLSELTADPVIMDYAMQRAAECCVYYSHTRPNGKEWHTVFGDAYMIGSKGENIAIGQVSAQSVMEAWMNSEGHRANILDADYNSVGVGCFYQPDGSIAWVQLFYSETCQEPETRNTVEQVFDVEISIKVSNMVGYVEHYTFSNAFCAAYLYEGSTIGTDFYLVNPGFPYQKVSINMDSVKYTTSNSDVFKVNNQDYTITATGEGAARLGVIIDGWEISLMDDAGYINPDVTVEVMKKPALYYSFDERGNILIDYSEFNSNLTLYYKGNHDDMWTAGNWEADNVYTHYYPDPNETYVYVMRYYDPYLDDFIEIGDRLVVQLGDEEPDPDPDPNPDPNPNPDPEPIPGVDLPPIPDWETEPTVQEALDILAQLKELCPTGTEWTQESYTWLGGSLDVLGNEATGENDMAFCMALSDRVFGDLPAKVIYDVTLDDLRPGDILMDSILGSMIVMDMGSNYLYCATLADGKVTYHLLHPANYNGYVTCALVRYESEALGVAAFNPTPVPEDANIVAYGSADYAQSSWGETTYYAIITWVLDDEGTMYFYGKGDLKSTSHSSWAAYYDQIKRIVFSSRIEEIDSFAFQRFNQLEEVVLGEDMKIIGEYAFDRCSSLRTINFPEGLESIEHHAFQDCNLTEADFPESLKEIGQNAFRGNSIETLRLPEGLELLGDGAFSNNEKLVSLYIPASIQEMGDYAFGGCTSLSQLELAEGITVLGEYAFSSCESLTSVTIPGSLTELPEGLFQCCGLEIVYFEKGVQVIGEYTFYHCADLSAIYLYNTVTAIEDCAFDGCEQLWNVYFYGTYEQWDAVEVGTNNTCFWFAWVHYEDPDQCLHLQVEIVFGTDATCTQDGLSEGSICADCGEVLTEQETIPALGHDWSHWQETVAPTEEAPGREERTCNRCSETESRELEPLEHVHEYTSTVTEPTCTETGCITYTCRCGDSYTEELPKADHTYADGECVHCGAPEVQLGDVNGDGRINVRDARAILRYIAGLVGEDELNVNAADFNGDGRVNVRDARTILNYIAGMA